jgi:hypothetical protein
MKRRPTENQDLKQILGKFEVKSKQNQGTAKKEKTRALANTS